MLGLSDGPLGNSVDLPAGQDDARTTKQDGRNFVDEVGVNGDSTQTCKFPIVLDAESSTQDRTFMITDWFKRVPSEVLG